MKQWKNKWKKSQAKEKMNEWRIEEMNQQINDDESMIKESMAQRTKEAMNTEYVSPWIHESMNQWRIESMNLWITQWILNWRIHESMSALSIPGYNFSFREWMTNASFVACFHLLMGTSYTFLRLESAILMVDLKDWAQPAKLQRVHSRGLFLAAIFLFVFWILFWRPWWTRFVAKR